MCLKSSEKPANKQKQWVHTGPRRSTLIHAGPQRSTLVHSNPHWSTPVYIRCGPTVIHKGKPHLSENNVVTRSQRYALFRHTGLGLPGDAVAHNVLLGRQSMARDAADFWYRPPTSYRVAGEDAGAFGTVCVAIQCHVDENKV